MSYSKRRLLITGAAGGVGRACARILGTSHDLVLTDSREQDLSDLQTDLCGDGYTVTAAYPGDLADDHTLKSIAAEIGDAPFTVLHAAAVSPAIADWRTILCVNVRATEKLLRVLEPLLRPGSITIMVASAAGYRMPRLPQIQTVMEDPLASDFVEQAGETIRAAFLNGEASELAGLAYSLSKQAMHRMCEMRAPLWGASGARIVTISPGLLMTPMGRKEMASSAGAASMAGSNPIARVGHAIDVAMAVRFLASEDAAFITGCDLRIDGGAIAKTWAEQSKGAYTNLHRS